MLLIAFIAGVVVDRLFYDKIKEKLALLYAKLKAKLL